MATADPVYNPPLGGGDSSSTLSEKVGRGASLAGITGDVAFFWDDFEYAVSQAAQKWAMTSSGSSGSTITVGGTSAGWIGLNTGATAGSVFDLTTQTSWVADSRTVQWYVGARFRISTSVDAAAIVGVGLDDGSAQSVIVGFTGPAHATNFSAQYAGRYTGSALNLAVAADTNAHVFEMWCTGDGVLNACIDAGATVSAATGVSVATAIPRVVVHNGATAAGRTMLIDWTLFVTER
jgi:hypothetical protein